MRCAEKIAYPTQAEAEATRKQMVRKRFKGRALRRLDVFKCPQCFNWHLGHARKPVEKPAPPQKIPRAGDLRRKLERMQSAWERQDDYQRRQRAAALGRLIEAERAMVDAQNEYAEIARQVTALFLPAPR